MKTETLKTERTQGEWKVNPVETAHCDIIVAHPLGKGGFIGQRICRMSVDFDTNSEFHISSEQAEANAAYICKAVNNYDKLVYALEQIANCEGFPLNKSDAIGFVKIANDALKNINI